MIPHENRVVACSGKVDYAKIYALSGWLQMNTYLEGRCVSHRCLHVSSIQTEWRTINLSPRHQRRIVNSWKTKSCSARIYVPIAEMNAVAIWGRTWSRTWSSDQTQRFTIQSDFVTLSVHFSRIVRQLHHASACHGSLNQKQNWESVIGQFELCLSKLSDQNVWA